MEGGVWLERAGGRFAKAIVTMPRSTPTGGSIEMFSHSTRDQQLLGVNRQ
jgi:hypothetical protein